jgi:hypothetical protein
MNGTLSPAPSNNRFRSIPATFYLGLLLYIISFFLPSLDALEQGAKGWACAYWAAMVWPQQHLFLALFGALINLLAFPFISLRLRGRAPVARRTLAFLILACIPLTWLSLADLGARIRVGHIVWIAGLLLMLVPEDSFWPRVQDLRWVAVPPLLILVWWSLKLVLLAPLQSPTEKDIFLYGVAMQFKDPGPCERISRFAEGSGGGMGPPGYEISYLQSQCFYNLAGSLHDLSLCDRVRPISKGVRNGSNYSPSWCRVRPGAAAGMVNSHTIETWMQRLGYKGEDIQHALYPGAFNSPISNQYDRLKQDPEFSKRIDAGPNFEDPSADNVNRLANDLEYVYQMYAVDTYNPAVCGKISRQAVAINGVFPVALRLACYSAIAIDGRNLSGCSMLPLRSELRYWESPRGSREECLRVIPLLGPAGGARSGPVYPKTSESLQRGLHDLGYDVSFPETTAGDYEKFLVYLENRDPAARAEFLRRVAAIN